jgi:hypothetical protein
MPTRRRSTPAFVGASPERTHNQPGSFTETEVSHRRLAQKMGAVVTAPIFDSREFPDAVREWEVGTICLVCPP